MNPDVETVTRQALRWAQALLAISLVAGCGEDEWAGYVYPNKDDLTRHEYIGVYPSLFDCRDAALAKISLLPNRTRADYECGLNCEPAGSGVSVCEKTLR